MHPYAQKDKIQSSPSRALAQNTCRFQEGCICSFMEKARVRWSMCSLNKKKASYLQPRTLAPTARRENQTMFVVEHHVCNVFCLILACLLLASTPPTYTSLLAYFQFSPFLFSCSKFLYLLRNLLSIYKFIVISLIIIV